jgi:hypothetical protein
MPDRLVLLPMNNQAGTAPPPPIPPVTIRLADHFAG